MSTEGELLNQLISLCQRIDLVKSDLTLSLEQLSRVKRIKLVSSKVCFVGKESNSNEVTRISVR